MKDPKDKYRILIVDDDRAVCASLSLLLGKKGFWTEQIHNPNAVLDKINAFQPHVILLDMNFTIETSGKQGLKLLKQIRSSFEEVSIILMTGWGNRSTCC